MSVSRSRYLCYVSGQNRCVALVNIFFSFKNFKIFSFEFTEISFAFYKKYNSLTLREYNSRQKNTNLGQVSPSPQTNGVIFTP